jgi:SepF-like predicted cell division protein (DUF552 family)
MANVLTKLAEKVFMDSDEVEEQTPVYIQQEVKEDPFPIRVEEFKKHPLTHKLKFYTLSYTTDFSNIQDELHTVNQIAIININPLRERSTPIVVNILTKLKQIAKQIGGDIGALHNGWIILTPRHSEVYRKDKLDIDKIIS